GRRGGELIAGVEDEVRIDLVFGDRRAARLARGALGVRVDCRDLLFELRGVVPRRPHIGLRRDTEGRHEADGKLHGGYFTASGGSLDGLSSRARASGAPSAPRRRGISPAAGRRAPG